MRTQPELQEFLENILGTRNVYFQPPSGLKIKYPAIIYSLDRISDRHADNDKYITSKTYSITYVDSKPDSPMVDKLNAIPTCKFIRPYTADNLNHYVFSLNF